MQTIKLGPGYTLTIPEEIRVQLRMEVGDPFALIVEDGGIRIESLLESYTPERIAEFLLNNSCNEQDYRENLSEVLKLGVDPLNINPDYLSREEPWQRAEAHQDLLRVRRTS